VTSGTLRPPLGERDHKAGVLRRDPFLGGLDDQLQQVGVAQARHLGHQIELAVPAPAGVRVDLEQPDLRVHIGAEIEPGVVSAAENFRIIDDLARCLLVKERLPVAYLQNFMGDSAAL
jgi:hypothetical protein